MRCRLLGTIPPFPSKLLHDAGDCVDNGDKVLTVLKELCGLQPFESILDVGQTMNIIPHCVAHLPFAFRRLTGSLRIYFYA